MPAVAAAASWLEAFKLPMREIRKRYTKSEMAILAWRSQEVGYNMRSTNQPKPRTDANLAGKPAFNGVPPVLSTEAEQALEERLGPLAVKLGEIEDEHGMDFRKLTGAEALQYMDSMGIRIGGRQ